MIEFLIFLVLVFVLIPLIYVINKFCIYWFNPEEEPAYKESSCEKYIQYIRYSSWEPARWYNIDTNTFVDDPYTAGAWPITTREFEKLFVNDVCACPVGEGRDIHTGYHYTIDDFNEDERLGDYILLENPKGCSFLSGRPYSLYHACDKRFISGMTELSLWYYKTPYYKKACVACRTCMDEYEKGIKEILKAINKYEEKLKRDKRVEEICG